MSAVGRIIDALDDRISRLTERNKELEAVMRVIAEGFDCDTDAHRYGTFCRVCEAKKILAAKDTRKETKDADGDRSGQAGLQGH